MSNRKGMDFVILHLGLYPIGVDYSLTLMGQTSRVSSKSNGTQVRSPPIAISANPTLLFFSLSEARRFLIDVITVAAPASVALICYVLKHTCD